MFGSDVVQLLIYCVDFPGLNQEVRVRASEGKGEVAGGMFLQVFMAGKKNY